MAEETLLIMIVIGALVGLIWAVRKLGEDNKPAQTRTPAATVSRRSQPVRRAPKESPAQPSKQNSIHLGPPQPMEVERPPAMQVNGRRMQRRPPLELPPPHQPLWWEKGWRENGEGYEGYYYAAGKKWRGLIKEPYAGKYQAYIYNPPLTKLRNNTGHGACFGLNDDGTEPRKVHFSREPGSLDHAIATIEVVLNEAFGVKV